MHLWYRSVKFIDQGPLWYIGRVKEAIHIRLHPNNINRDSRIEIPEAWMSGATIKQWNGRLVPQQTRDHEEQCLVNAMGIEILQSLTTTAWITLQQSPTATVLHIVRHSQSS